MRMKRYPATPTERTKLQTLDLKLEPHSYTIMHTHCKYALTYDACLEMQESSQLGHLFDPAVLK